METRDVITSRKKEIQKRIAGLLAACRARGIKATHQRVEIMRELASTEEHPDADALYQRVRERIPTMALDTVYRTLKLLEENGIVSRVGCTRERARFDGNTARHHHFVCTKCGLVRDFHDETFDSLKAPREVPEMGCVNSVYVELRGLCQECRKQNRKAGDA